MTDGSEVVQVGRHHSTAVVTLARPAVRNAVSGELLTALRTAMTEADQDDTVKVIVLTGQDPVFCAGLDLKALAAADPVLASEAAAPSHRPWPVTTKPVIGAINGPAVTGGLEIALACDLLVASERATFADTHARVGVMPSWQISVRLPAAVGRRTAAWMSLTGRPLDAERAFQLGLVTQVVAHEDLLTTSLSLADEVAAVDEAAAKSLLHSYRQVEDLVWREGFDQETRTGETWRAAHVGFASIERIRAEVIAGGRARHATDGVSTDEAH